MDVNMESPEDLVNAFHEYDVDLDPGLVNQCFQLIAEYELSPDKLAEKWEVFSFKRKLGQPTEALFLEFRKALDQEKVKAFVRESKKQGIMLYSAQDMVEEFGFREYEDTHAQCKTPSPISRHRKPVGTKRVSAIHTPPYLEDNSDIAKENAQDGGIHRLHPASSFSVGQREEKTECSPFSKRQGARTVCDSHNGHLLNGDQASWASLCENQSPEIKLLSKYVRPSTKYLTGRLEDVATMIELRILNFLKSFEGVPSEEASAGGEIEGFATDSCAVATPDIVQVAGRIVLDAEGEGRLNSKSILLEGCLTYSKGHSVRLDLSSAKQAVSLFPGQVVIAKGRNTAGHCLSVTELYTAAPYPIESTRRDPGYKDILVASGPFSTTEDLSYEPLDELIKVAAEEQPHALIMLGPFVDIEHPAVLAGRLSKTYPDVFLDHVYAKVESFADQNPDIKVILIPSPKDVHHDPSFPQPAMSEIVNRRPNFEEHPGKIFLAPNPCVLDIDGLVVAACAHDILKHLSAEEVAHGALEGNRIARLAGHIVGQRHFYPLFPPALGSMMDPGLTLNEELAITSKPDILILPSDLATGSHLLNDDITFLNPGRLARGPSGGKFARIRVAPIIDHKAAHFVDDETDKSIKSSSTQSSVASRTSIEVLRI